MSTTKSIWPFVVTLTAIALFYWYWGSSSRPFGAFTDAAPERPPTTRMPWPSASNPPLRSERVDREPRNALATEPTVSAAIEELLATSESFRNTTLLIAIRDAGYLCRDLLDAEQGADGVPAWRVTCSDALAYFVAADAAGKLGVDPMPYTEGGPLGAAPLNELPGENRRPPVLFPQQDGPATDEPPQR